MSELVCISVTASDSLDAASLAALLVKFLLEAHITFEYDCISLIIEPRFSLINCLDS